MTNHDLQALEDIKTLLNKAARIFNSLDDYTGDEGELTDLCDSLEDSIANCDGAITRGEEENEEKERAAKEEEEEEGDEDGTE